MVFVTVSAHITMLSHCSLNDVYHNLTERVYLPFNKIGDLIETYKKKRNQIEILERE